MNVRIALRALVYIALLAFVTFVSANSFRSVGLNNSVDVAQALASTPTLVNRAFLPIVLKEAANWAENKSYCTTCAEEDNLNIPIFARQISRFKVKATHPTYDVGVDNCQEDFSGCGSGAKIKATQTDPCFADENNKIYDDHISNALWACPEPNWWRPYSMNVLVDANERSVQRLVWLRKISDADSWPQFLVLYEDGNMRLKPHPPLGRSDVCFGSSVIIGPAVPSSRPYVDVQQVQVNPSALSLNLTYRSGGTAHIILSVDRSQAVATVDISYPTNTTTPFATFRSMYVSDGKADADHIETSAGDLPFLIGPPTNWTVAWTSLAGPWWFFHRTVRSTHNTSAPDIRIEVLN